MNNKIQRTPLSIADHFFAGLIAEALYKKSKHIEYAEFLDREQFNADRLKIFNRFYDSPSSPDVASLRVETELDTWSQELTIMIADYTVNGKDITEFCQPLIHNREQRELLSTIARQLFCLRGNFKSKYTVAIPDVERAILGTGRIARVAREIRHTHDLEHLFGNILSYNLTDTEVFLYGVLSCTVFPSDWARIVRNCPALKDEERPVYYGGGFYDMQTIDGQVVIEYEDLISTYERPLPGDKCPPNAHALPYADIIVKVFPEYGLMEGIPMLTTPHVLWHHRFEKHCEWYSCWLLGSEDGPIQQMKPLADEEDE